jgi:hypothetical protein
MSLDMTVGAREAAIDSSDDEIETQAAAATPVWLADRMMVAGTTLGVVVCSTLGVLLFLR